MGLGAILPNHIPACRSEFILEYKGLYSCLCPNYVQLIRIKNSEIPKVDFYFIQITKGAFCMWRWSQGDVSTTIIDWILAVNKCQLLWSHRVGENWGGRVGKYFGKSECGISQSSKHIWVFHNSAKWRVLVWPSSAQYSPLCILFLLHQIYSVDPANLIHHDIKFLLSTNKRPGNRWQTDTHTKTHFEIPA